MFKQFKKVVSTLLIAFTVFSSVIPAFAANPESKGVKVTSLKDIDLGEYAPYILDSGDPSIQPRPSAPPLTAFNLNWINSPQAGEEYMTSSSQISSKLDHGGEWFQAVTVEVGYPNPNLRFTYLNRSRMSLTEVQTLDFNNDSIVDGWMCLWDIDGFFYSGNFTAESTSVNAPWNTMSIGFNVR